MTLRFSRRALLLLAMSSFDVGSALPVLATEKVDSINWKTAPPEFLPFETRNVVSFVLPKQGKLTLQELRNVVGSPYWSRGEVQTSVVDDTLLVSTVLPEWYSEPEEEALRSNVKGVLEEYIARDVILNGNRARFAGDFNSVAIIDVMMDVYAGAPAEIMAKNRAKITSLVGDKETKVQLSQAPTVYYYEAGTGAYLGETTYPNGKATFTQNKKPDPPGVSTAYWTKAPILIEPLVELEPAHAYRPVQLPRAEGVWTMTELVQFLNGQDLKVVNPDAKFANQKLYLAQHGNWTVGDLLRSVCAAGGYELERRAGVYTFKISRGHHSVAGSLWTHHMRSMAYDWDMGMVHDIFDNPQNQADMQFEEALFHQTEPVPVASLDAAVKTKALEPLKPELRAKVGLVWFARDVQLGLSGKTTGATMGLSMLPFPAQFGLYPPKGWVAFKPKEFEDYYGATLWLAP